MWHQYRHALLRCELVLTDAVGVETMAKEAISQARQAYLFGCQRAFVNYAYPDAPRDIDILFVVNFSAAIHRERLPWWQAYHLVLSLNS